VIQIPSGAAARCDMNFARQWKRQQRVLILEIVAIHLELKMGAKRRELVRRSHRDFSAGDGRVAGTRGKLCGG
jgi:hypothetical protein